MQGYTQRVNRINALEDEIEELSDEAEHCDDLRKLVLGVHGGRRRVVALHGVEVDPSKMDTGGRLDPHLFHELLSSHDLPSETEHLHALSDAYVERMHHHFARETWADALPGARTLVETVHEHAAMTASVSGFEPDAKLPSLP